MTTTNGFAIGKTVRFGAVSTPAFPNFSGKHAHESIITPGEMMSAAISNNPRLRVPDAVILTYSPWLLAALDRLESTLVEGYPGPLRSLRIVEAEHRCVGVAGGFGVGAPVAAMVLEQLAAVGVRQFISIGAAGCLQPGFEFGDIVVCTGAIRDEGVSHHYLPTQKFAYPSETLTEALRSELGDVRSGLAWTIDAPYRETVAEARSYQAEGIVCVEMEAAALFAIGEFRQVEVASAFAVSDHLLAEDTWTHAFGTDQLRRGMAQLLEAALAVFGVSPNS
jgi:uridine phosphorylase